MIMNDLPEAEQERLHQEIMAEERLIIIMKIFRMACMFGMGYITGLLTTLAILHSRSQ